MSNGVDQATYRPEVVIVADKAQIGALVGDRFVATVNQSESPVLGVATGSSPIPVYEYLSHSGTDFSTTRFFALDEYVGLAGSDPHSYRYFLDQHLTGPLHLDSSQVMVPDGQASDLTAASAYYEQELAAAGGVDLQLLGIGRNGHIGFNEPGSALDSRTREVQLTANTRAANARFFSSAKDVPHSSLTQGIGTILDASAIVMIATGADKADAVMQLIGGPITPDRPASALQMHPHVTLFVDQEAASHIDRPHVAAAVV